MSGRWTLVAVLLLVACGRRSGLLDSAPPYAPPDGAATADRGVPADLDRSCSRFAAFAKGVRLTDRHVVSGLFLSDTRGVVLATRTPSGSVDLQLFSLPLSSPKTIASDLSIGGLTWLEQDRTLLVALDAGAGRSTLVAQPIDGSPATTLADDVCYFQIVPDGARVYVIAGCDATLSQGTLKLVDRAGGTTTLESNVSRWSLALAADGKHLAYILDDTPSRRGGCGPGGLAPMRGTLHETEPSGIVLGTVAPDVGVGTVEYTRHGVLLWEEVPACIAGPGEGLLSHMLAPGTMLQHGGFTFASGGPRRYQVSEDGKWVIGAEAVLGATTDKLYAVAPDGSGQKLIASDAFARYAFPLQAWAFAAGGTLVYITGTYPDAGLAAVTVPDGQPIQLTRSLPDLYWVTAPAGDAVVYAAGQPDSRQLVLSPLPPGKEVVLASNYQGTPLMPLMFLPDGRGLIYAEQPSRPALGPTYLRYVSRQGGPTLLGSCSSSLDPLLVVDPGSCVALYDTDQAPGPGAVLVALPR